MHVDYKTSEIFNRKVGSGGGYRLSLPYSASGYGPVNESEFSFDSVYDEINNNSSAYYLSNIKKEALQKHLKLM